MINTDDNKNNNLDDNSMVYDLDDNKTITTIPEKHKNKIEVKYQKTTHV